MHSTRRASSIDHPDTGRSVAIIDVTAISVYRPARGEGVLIGTIAKFRRTHTDCLVADVSFTDKDSCIDPMGYSEERIGIRDQ